MSKTATYALIDSQTLGSATSSVTFSPLPGTYTDLIIVAVPIMASTGTSFIARFNSDTGSNYSQTYVYGASGSALSSRDVNVTSIYFGSSGVVSTSDNRTCIMHVMDYANTTTYKTVLIRDSYTQNIVTAAAGLWRSTSAITSITIGASSNNLSAGTTIKLYGIQAGNA